MYKFEEYKRGEVGISADDYGIQEHNFEQVIGHITNWFIEYLDSNKKSGLIVELDGGLDSLVTTVLCLKTGYPTIIHDNSNDLNLIEWLKSNFDNIQEDLSVKELYVFCEGTNKIDLQGLKRTKESNLNPIGGLTKTDVKKISNILNLPYTSYDKDDIEGFLGFTYVELEWACDYVEEYSYLDEGGVMVFDDRESFMLNEREKEVLLRYLSLDKNMDNKCIICEIPNEIL
jgi:hypothetical protein